jgi:apolipoprotein N-acyltransferase
MTAVAKLAALPERVGALRGGFRLATAAAAGACLTLAQPPLSLWPVLFVAWPVLLWLTRGAKTVRGAGWLGWWAGFGFFLTGLYWIGEAFLVEASKVWWYLPLMPLAIGLLAAVVALFWAAAFALASRIGGTGWREALALSVTLSAMEALRGTVLTGFPWALQAYAWVETPVIQSAALIGAYGLTGLTLLATLLCGLWRPAPLLVAGGLAAAGWAWGAYRVPDTPQPAGAVIRMVQPAIDQRDKWRPENTGPIFRQLLDLSRSPGAVTPALVIWPEVAVTFLFDNSAEAIAAATSAMPGGTTLAVGSVRAEPGAPGRRLFNSLLFYANDGTQLGAYDKRKLTPFGEYVPYASVLGMLGLGTLGDGLSGFTSGVDPGPFALPGLPPAVVLICYEIIFPGLTRDTAGRGDWIIQVTNDAWFGNSAGPYQHLAQARVRAIETGLPIARAANTGISAMIDSYGRLTATLGLGRRGVVDAPLPRRLGSPVFARLGNAVPLAVLAVAIAILTFGHRRHR